MNKRENIFLQLLKKTFQTIGPFAALLAIAITTNASAVRTAPASLSSNGQLLGGFYEVTAPIPGVLPHHTLLSDATPDGELAVFTTTLAVENFVPGVRDSVNVNANSDVIVRNMRTGEMFCASCKIFQGDLVAATGSQARISADGRYVVYSGFATGPTLAVTHIFRVDLQTGSIETVSVGTAPETLGNSNSTSPVISDDGRFVAFISTATNLVAGYPTSGSGEQLFVRDMQTGQTFLVSHISGSMSQPANAPVSTFHPISISGNGRFIVWTSAANNYLPVFDQNGFNDVYIYDTQFPTLAVGVISANFAGSSTGNGASFGGVVSADSTASSLSIVFASNATNLHPADTNPATDIFCYKGEATARLVSVSRNGTAANAASSNYATISRNGRFVAFTSKASNLVNGIDEPNAETNDVFLHDFQIGATRYVSLNAAGQPSATADGAGIRTPLVNFPGAYLSKNISNDGQFVAFATTEPLSPRDNQNTLDVYVRDMNAGVSILASLGKTGSGGQNAELPTVGDLALSGEGRKIAFTSHATNLAAGDATTIQNMKVFRSHVSLLSERSASDVNGDGKNDFAVFRPSEGNWYTLYNSGGGSYETFLFGESGNRIAPGDYDGDSRTDYAVFVPAFGRWDILQSSNGELVTKFFGTATDVLTPADFDGDGRTDPAYYRPSTSTWFILQSNTNSLRSVKFGLTGDLPTVGDFDGDNRADVALFRPATGDWWVLRSLDNNYYSFHWGMTGDKPAVGDFDGDGKSDAAVFRDGTWYILNSRDNTYQIFQWGLGTDRPVVSDYDGDKRTDVAVFRAADGVWYVRQSSNGNLAAVQWGTTGDVPVPAAFMP